MKILLATPCAGDVVYRRHMLSILSETFMHPDRLRYQDRYQIAHYTVAGDSGLGKDRGLIASYAVRNGFDKLFMVDSDQVWVWQQFRDLVDSDKPIIAGVVGLKKYPVQLNFTPKVEDAHCFEPEDKITTYAGLRRLIAKHTLPNTKINEQEIEVQAVGTGFICIDVKVLKALALSKDAPAFRTADPNPFTPKARIAAWDFFQTGVINEEYYGEDWGFSIIAARAGFKSYINASILVEHIGNHSYFPYNNLIDSRLDTN